MIRGFPLLVFILLATTGFAQTGRAVMVREANVYLSPDLSAQKIGVVGRGREVAILGKTREFLHVLASLDAQRDVTGWVLDKGVIRPTTPDGDSVLFGEASDSEEEASRRRGRRDADKDALRLYARIVEYFPNSPLAGEALWRAADIRWQVEREGVMSRPSAKEQDASLRGKITEDFMREVIKKFPGTKWADLAAYNMLDNKVCGDWQGLPKCPEKESELYEKYAREHPQSPKAAEALYQAARRQAALMEIYTERGDRDKAAGAKSRANALAQTIATQYPKQGDWAARALRLKYLVETGIATYGTLID